MGQWVRALVNGAGVPCNPSVPAAKQEAFNAEARGTGPTINTDQVPRCMVGIFDPSSAPQVQAYGVVAEPKGQRPLFKVDKYNGPLVWKRICYSSDN